LGLFDRLFQKQKIDEGPTDIRFGRYSDAYKESEQYDLWDQSLALFEEQSYLDAYERFLQYLNDPAEENIIYQRTEASLTFEIIQGSKKLIGYSDGSKLKVEANVAKMNSASEALLRHLLEYNYQLRYCRFGLTEDHHIAIIFDTTTIDGSPYKLYYAFKEAANHADKIDDLLIHDYDNVEHTYHDLFHHITAAQKKVKYSYLTNEINKTIKLIESDKANQEGYNGGKAYALLSLAYRIDYLIKPEGYLMDRLEEINSIYFSNEITDVDQKIDMIKTEYRSILAHDPDTLQSEMYWVKSTFGITAPVNHDRIVNFIDGELANMDWYLEHEHETIAQSIPEYIIGYALFHFAPPKPDLDLLQLYLRITEHEYFHALGFTTIYIDEGLRYNRKAIKLAIEQVMDKNKDQFPNLDADVSSLQYGSRVAFAKSYLRMIQLMDLTRR